MSSPSIRRTLLIRCGIGTGILASVLSVSIYLMVRHSLYAELDESLRGTASILANQMEYEHGEIIFEWQEGIGANPSLDDASLFQYWDEKSGFATRSPALRTDDLPKFTGPDGTPDIETIVIPGRLEHARAIGMLIHPYIMPEENAAMKAVGLRFDAKAFPHTLVVARDLTPILRTLAELAAILCIGTLVTLALGFFVIDRAIRSSLTPIASLTDQVRGRSGERLDSPIVLPGGIPLELTPLAESFETLLSRVAAIRSRERDFIRHASHELRTPIAALGAITELALSRPRSTEEYARHLKSCGESADNLAGLVSRLSALSRIGSRDTPPEAVPISLRETLSQALEESAPALSASRLTVSVSPEEGDVTALADPTLTRLILRNLLDNASSYAPSGSTLAVILSESGGRCIISLANPAQSLPENPDRLFEPLFRNDPSRSSSQHLGIGLTLSREAAEAMHATLTVDLPDKESICFTLSLPSVSSKA
jgi:signal transduction histidine kinase